MDLKNYHSLAIPNKALYDYLCMKWKLDQVTDPNFLPSIECVKNVVHGYPMDLNNLDLNNAKYLDRVLLYSRPYQIVNWYTWMKAYGNHFRVEDSKNNSMQTFDNGIASIFDMPTFDARDPSNCTFFEY
jgi:hypothetical protein